jgi:predicted ATPase
LGGSCCYHGAVDCTSSISCSWVVADLDSRYDRSLLSTCVHEEQRLGYISVLSCRTNTNAMHVYMYEMQKLRCKNSNHALSWALQFIKVTARQLDQQCLPVLIAPAYYSLISQSPAASIGLCCQRRTCVNKERRTT